MEEPDTQNNNNNNDNQNHEFATNVHFEGKTYYITRDNKVFTLENGKYILSSEDEIKKLINFLNPKKPYVVYNSHNTFGDRISIEDVYNAIKGTIIEEDLLNNKDESEELGLEWVKKKFFIKIIIKKDKFN